MDKRDEGSFWRFQIYIRGSSIRGRTAATSGLSVSFTYSTIYTKPQDLFNVSTERLETGPHRPISPEYTNIWNVKHGWKSIQQRKALYNFPKVTFLQRFPCASKTYLLLSYKSSGRKNVCLFALQPDLYFLTARKQDF